MINFPASPTNGQTYTTGTLTFVYTSSSQSWSKISYVPVINTVSNISGGIAGYIPIQSSPSITSFINTGTVGYVLQMQTGNTATWVSTSSLGIGGAAISPYSGIFTITNITGASSTNTGAIQAVGGIGLGGGIYAGAAVTATYIVANGPITASSTLGAYSYGALSYTDINIFGEFQTSTSSYAQLVLQNTNAGGSASTDFVISNNAGTSANFYANFGINSNSYTGSGSFNLPNASYVASAGGDLAIGTYGNNSIRFVLNSGNTDIVTISTITTSVNILSVIQAISTSTGALQVQGGVGIGGNLYVGGNLYATVSGSITTATNVAGGVQGSIPIQSAVGITSFINTGTVGYVLQMQTGNTATWVSTGSLGFGGSGAISPYSGIFTVTNTTVSTSTNTGALQVAGGVGIGGNLNVGGSLTVNGNSAVTSDTAGNVKITSTATSNSTNTGALQVAGGVGIGGNLYVGGNLYATVSGSITTSTNITGGAPGLIPVQSAAGVTSFINTGAVGTLLQMQVNNTATFVSTTTLQVGNATYATTASSAAFATGAGTATSISGGIAGLIHIQSAPSVTSFINTGAVGTLLQMQVNNTATFVSTTTLQVGNAVSAISANTVQTVLQTGAASYYPTFVSANNAAATAMSLYTTSSFTVNPSNGNISISGITTVTNITTATSSSTGALVVTGGVGIGANMYVGTFINAYGNITAFYSSDQRLKENVQVLPNALESIQKIRGVSFDWTDDYINRHGGEDGYFVRKRDIGVIAQELQAILPEVVAERNDGYLGVKYDRIVPLLIEAIKELDEKLEQEKTKNSSFEERITQLEKLINSLIDKT